jgi:hypothetical protein|mmetsp:Transcript_14485/g.23766  ORF Transcript_14485/g.23766 Transcript_14485/m.23766 type:complete len:543 (+) Transcript_14485:73-1701(+)
MQVFHIVFFASGIVLAEATAFLGRLQPKHAPQSEHVLLATLDKAFGSENRQGIEKRVERIEQMLNPMFEAMEKNEYGNAGPAATGYMLHRLFVQMHGWFIRALEPKNGSYAAWNTSTPIAMLSERVPGHIAKLFEDRLGQRGLGLKDLAILAALIEHLVHLEAIQRLNVSYGGAGFSFQDVLDDNEVIHLLDVYMSVYIASCLHSDLNTLTHEMASHMHEHILEVYPTWPETQQFLREIHASFSSKNHYYTFNEVGQEIAEIGDRYGRYQDVECRQLKNTLVEVEDPGVGGAGRVRLADFYGRALNDGMRQFTETGDYLRRLGALDESDASNPRVIIANYISAPSNCVASSAYYTVCCLDECEGILNQVEQGIKAPEALPEAIIDLVSMIPSATMPSNRSLSPWLRQRLTEVAEHHDGLVPLHGRLFAQWLHYAYPRECQFPHVSGTINPIRPEDLEHPEEAQASDVVMQSTIERAPPQKKRVPGLQMDAMEESPMWSSSEELVVARPAQDLSIVGRMASVVKKLESSLTSLRKAPADTYVV